MWSKTNSEATERPLGLIQRQLKGERQSSQGQRQEKGWGSKERRSCPSFKSFRSPCSCQTYGGRGNKWHSTKLKGSCSRQPRQASISNYSRDYARCIKGCQGKPTSIPCATARGEGEDAIRPRGTHLRTVRCIGRTPGNDRTPHRRRWPQKDHSIRSSDLQSKANDDCKYGGAHLMRYQFHWREQGNLGTCDMETEYCVFEQNKKQNKKPYQPVQVQGPQSFMSKLHLCVQQGCSIARLLSGRDAALHVCCPAGMQHCPFAVRQA